METLCLEQKTVWYNPDM